MSTKQTKKRLSSSQVAIIIGLVIIAIPVCIFGGILGISWLQTGSPRNGDRFKNDLTPEITKAEVSDLETELKGLNGAESVEIVLSEGQLRVYIDCKDTLSEEAVDELLVNAYNKVNSKLPVGTYFKSTDSKKMYDLFINVYTTIQDSESRQYKVLHKNAAEDTYGIDDMAHPKDENLVKELHEEKDSEE